MRQGLTRHRSTERCDIAEAAIPMPNATLFLVGFLQPSAAEESRLNAMLRAFSRSFQESRSAPRSALVVLAAIVAVALVATLAWRALERWQSARADAEALARLARERGLDEADLALLHMIAARDGTTALAAGRHLDVFERAVAAELDGRARITSADEQDVFAATHRLRMQLGFATLRAEDAIISTRELEPGMPVELAGARSVVEEVTEASFSLSLPQLPEVAPGARLSLSIVHLDEAKYFVTCELLSVVPTPEGCRVAFGHDEHPARTQRRRYARVRPGGEATVQCGGDQGALGRPRITAEGTLLDVGVGGAAVQTMTSVEPRTHAWATFSVGEVAFHDVEARVLGCEGPPGGPYRLRLEFIRLSADNLHRFGRAISAR